jgi:hypothetical protein
MECLRKDRAPEGSDPSSLRATERWGRPKAGLFVHREWHPQ